ncbi:Uncharacterized membrane protein [Sphingobacterium nematocida]|uniref:Uncharacterized membrane protein n=1 Tax=Sphingobacterium nematocida TaxID=1513896 RepID=A0A1T5CA97_9SPHI|nr:DUF4870 domain-containing protein [Sphingobacterium nematocida]SKB56276.1 Uncharacterized membrane protein [Sphingobacterium nematocida]
MDNKSVKNSVQEGKNIAIISYITLIGLIIAFVMNKDKNNNFAKFHIRQNMGLLIVGLISGILRVVPVAGEIIAMIVGTILLILWIMGLISAFNGSQKELPFVGQLFQKWFSTL